MDYVKIYTPCGSYFQYSRRRVSKSPRSGDAEDTEIRSSYEPIIKRRTAPELNYEVTDRKQSCFIIRSPESPWNTCCEDTLESLKTCIPTKAIDIISDWLLSDYLEGTALEDSYSAAPETPTQQAS